MNFNPSIWVKKCSIFGTLLFSSSFVFAIDSLRVSLDDVLDKALANSKFIHKELLNVKIQDELVQQKKSDLLPKISMRGSASYATNMPIYDNGIFNKPSQHDVIHYLYDSGADFYLNVYNGHRDLMQIEMQKMTRSLTSIISDEASGKIKLEVCQLFLELQLAYSNKTVIEKDIEDQKVQLEEINNLFKAGVVLHSDVLRISLELSKREMLLLKITNDIASLNQKLQLITGISAVIIPLNHVVDKTLPAYPDIVNEAKHSAYILQKSEKSVALKKLAIKQAQSNYLPEIGLTGTYTFANPQIFLYPYNDSWYSLGIVGIKVNVPISSIYQNRHNVQASKLAYEREKVIHHDEEDQVCNALYTAYLDYKLALEQRDICTKNVHLSIENARIIRNRYFKSAALITDLLDADMQHLQTLFELEAARISIQKQFYYIEFLKGTI